MVEEGLLESLGMMKEKRYKDHKVIDDKVCRYKEKVVDWREKIDQPDLKT